MRIGELEVIESGDLVAVLHRTPIMHPVTHTFIGVFEGKPHWTQLTPANARKLARALDKCADHLDAIQSEPRTK